MWKQRRNDRNAHIYNDYYRDSRRFMTSSSATLSCAIAFLFVEYVCIPVAHIATLSLMRCERERTNTRIYSHIWCTQKHPIYIYIYVLVFGWIVCRRKGYLNASAVSRERRCREIFFFDHSVACAKLLNKNA